MLLYKLKNLKSLEGVLIVLRHELLRESSASTASFPLVVDMICVECGHVVLDVYKQFSLGNIRLTRCVRYSSYSLASINLATFVTSNESIFARRI